MKDTTFTEEKPSQPPVDENQPSAPEKKSHWKKLLIRVTAFAGIFIFLLCAALIILSVAFGDEVKQFAVTSINKQLATEVKVNGPISFSVFSHFPYASVCFEEVSIVETLPEKNNFLSCKRITLLFNIKDLWSHNYVLRKVSADDGTVSIHINSAGERNYDIFKKKQDDASDFSLKVSNAELNRFVVTYVDEKNFQDYSFRTDRASLKGDFTSSKFTLELDADAFANFLKSNGIDYLPQRAMEVKGSVDVDLDQNKYFFRSVMALVNGNKFIVDGTVTSLNEGNDLQLKLSGNDLDVGKIISLLPPEYAQKLSAVKFSGGISFNGEISGVQSPSSTPLVKTNFHLSNATIGNDEFKQIFSHVTIDGNYSNGSNHSRVSSSLELNKFSASIAGNDVKGSFVLHNFLHPAVDAMLDGKVDLEKIYSLFKVDEVTAITGVVSFDDCYYRGELSALKSTSFDMKKIQAGGKFQLKNLKVVTPQSTYEDLNGAFEIRNNDITFSNCAFTAASSDLRFDGTVSNFFPFLFSALTDSTQVKQKIGLNAELSSGNLNWEDLVGKNYSASSNDDFSIPAIFYKLSGAVSGNVKTFSYKKFHAEEIHGKIIFLPNNIYFNNIGLKAENGTLTANGNLDISRSTRSKLDLTASLQQLDLTKLFYEFNNFDQNTLTDRHLKGTVTSNVSLQSVWDNNKLNLDALHAIADITVENGELNNFEPMTALATFVKLKELKNIQFSKLQNQIEIKNRRVYIPGMDIFSSAVNVHLSGSHGFDNMIDYKVQLNLLRLLTDKFRKSNRNTSETDQTTEGFLNLYLTMTGPASDPDIKYDKQAVKQKIATDLAEEKQNLKQILKKEFNQQDASQQQAKDWKPKDSLQYFEFRDSTESDSNEQSEKSATSQNQKKALDDFKNLFKKTPKKNQ